MRRLSQKKAAAPVANLRDFTVRKVLAISCIGVLVSLFITLTALGSQQTASAAVAALGQSYCQKVTITESVDNVGNKLLKGTAKYGSGVGVARCDRTIPASYFHWKIDGNEAFLGKEQIVKPSGHAFAGGDLEKQCAPISIRLVVYWPKDIPRYMKGPYTNGVYLTQTHDIPIDDSTTPSATFCYQHLGHPVIGGHGVPVPGNNHIQQK